MRTILMFAVTLGAAAAQTPQSEGPLAGVGVAVSVDAATGDPEEIRWKRAEFATAPPQRWPLGQPGPVFRAADLFYDVARPAAPFCGANCGTPSAPLEIDAISVGLDVIWANSDGAVVPQPNGWAALVFSLPAAAQGAVGSVLRGEVDRVDGKAGISADVWSHAVRGSRLPPAWVGVTQRALDASEIAMPPTAEIDALDVHLPFFRLDPALRNRLPAAAQPATFFFSVAPSSVAAVPAAWWCTSAPSAATVLYTQWQSATSSWSCPRVFRRYSDLELDANENLTALSIDLANSRMLLSTDSPGRDPLLFHDLDADGAVATTTYHYDEMGMETPVSEEIGLITGDFIDALCSTDPTNFEGGSPSAAGYVIGTPFPSITCFGAAVSGSAFRESFGGVPYLRPYMTGWTAAGPVPGFAVLLFAGASGLSPCCVNTGGCLLSPVSIAVPRDPTDPCGDATLLSGDPRGIPLPVLACAANCSVALQMLAVDTVGGFPGNLSAAYTIRFSLP